MYIRMTSGRERGEVKEFNFADAQDLLRSGQAVAVTFDGADPLAKKVDFEIRDEQAQLSPEPVAAPEPAFSEPAPMAKTPSTKFRRRN